MVIRFFATVLALALATFLVPGIAMGSKDPATDIAGLAGVSVIFGVVNSAVKPLFRRFGRTPVGLIVLGAALLVVNAGLLLLTSWICGMVHIPWHVSGPVAAIVGALVVSVVSFLVNSLFGSRGEVHR